MSKSFTNLGTKQLHKRHSVMIEGGMVPRARVMDQHVFDRYLMDGDLNIVEHRACEYVLWQAARAGLWARGANLKGSGGGRPGSVVPFGVAPYGKTMSIVRDRYGKQGVNVVEGVVVRGVDVRSDKSGMLVLRRSLNLIANTRMGSRNTDPLRSLKRKKAGAAEATPAG